MRRFLIHVAVTAVAASSAVNAEAAEWLPTYLGCVFTDSAFSASAIPELQIDEDRLKVSSTEFEMAFAAIDLTGQRAQLIGNLGTAEVRAFRGGYESIVFLEWTSGGSINVTTVLPPTKEGTINAVASRHIAKSIGGYSASQLLGTCQEHFGQMPKAAQ